MSHVAAPPLVACSDPIRVDPELVPHPRPFLCELTINDDQLSQVIAHVNNIEYVRWLDRAAEMHADAWGWTRPRLLERGWMWFVARHEVDYIAECWRGDRLVVATWVRDARRVRSWRDYTVLRADDDGAWEPVCRASTLWVLIDLETRRPRPIPDDMLKSFDALDRLPAS